MLFDDEADDPLVDGSSSSATSAGGGSTALAIVTSLLVFLVAAAAITLVVLLITGGVAQASQNDQENKLQTAKHNHRDVMEAIIAITGLPWEDAVVGGRPDACDKKAIINYDVKHGFSTA